MMYRQSYPRFLQSEIFNSVLQTTYAYNGSNINGGTNIESKPKPIKAESQQQTDSKENFQATISNTPSQHSQQDVTTQQYKTTTLSTSRTATKSATNATTTTSNKQKVERQTSLPTKSQRRDLQDMKKENKLGPRKSSNT